MLAILSVWSQLSLWTVIWNPDKALNVAKLIEYSGKKRSGGDDILQLSHLACSFYSEKQWRWGWFQFNIFLQGNLAVVLISQCGSDEASSLMTPRQTPGTTPLGIVESVKTLQEAGPKR